MKAWKHGMQYMMAWALVLMMIPVSGCANKTKKESGAKDEKKSLKVYVDIKDKHSTDILKFLIDDYKKANKDVEIDINNPLDSQKLEDEIVKGGTVDIIVTSRSNMINLTKKGLLGELTNFYSKGKISDKFYNIISSYGRVGDRYYGIGLMPYSLEILYNPQSLTKMNLTAPKNIVELQPILKKLNESNIKVPVLLTEDIDIYNIIGSILYSNMGDLSKIEKAFDGDRQSYKNLNDVQGVFDEINRLAKLGVMNRDSFEIGNESAINRLISGDTPILAGISYYSKSIKDTPVGLLEKYDISSVKENIPVIVNALICTPANTKNEENINAFMEYMYSDKAQKKLAGEGFVGANKENNANLVGANKIIDEHLSQANYNSIIYIYNFPEKFKGKLQAKIEKILSGKYSGNEWNEILDEIYK